MTWAKDLERAATRRIVIEIAHYAQFACRMKLYEWKKKKKKWAQYYTTWRIITWAMIRNQQNLQFNF